MGREPATHFAGLAAPWSIPGLLAPGSGTLAESPPTWAAEQGGKRQGLPYEHPWRAGSQPCE